MNKLEQFFMERGSSPATRRHYSSSVKLYEELNQLSMDTLIAEADAEEEERIRWKNRKIKQRLINFRNYLYANFTEGSVGTYLTDVKAIYRHFEIELQPLPRFDSKQIQKSYQMTFNDLPTKEELIDSYYEANNVVKCIILFASSSGISRSDMLNMTVADFIRGCGKEVSNTTLMSVLDELKHTQNLIPQFDGERVKTRKRYLTFCSPEASEHIVQYLIGRDAQLKSEYKFLVEKLDSLNMGTKEYSDTKKQLDSHPQCLTLELPLFGISNGHLGYVFNEINNKLNLGKVGGRSKIRCHMLRKYQASMLLNAKNSFTRDEVDSLQGRSLDKTHRAYFFNEAERLREKYISCVDELMLFKSIDTIDKKEHEKLIKENKLYKKELEAQSTKMVELEQLIEETRKNQRRMNELLGQNNMS